jgi:hypothetical protein
MAVPRDTPSEQSEPAPMLTRSVVRRPCRPFRSRDWPDRLVHRRRGLSSRERPPTCKGAPPPGESGPLRPSTSQEMRRVAGLLRPAQCMPCNTRLLTTRSDGPHRKGSVQWTADAPPTAARPGTTGVSGYSCRRGSRAVLRLQRRRPEVFRVSTSTTCQEGRPANGSRQPDASGARGAS